MSTKPRSAQEGVAAHWRGPFLGHDRYGNADHEYYECASCGVEVVDTTHASHREGCPHA
jgi:hypothetical protein